MDGPKQGITNDFRIANCKEDLKLAFGSLMEESRVAGWSPIEVCVALTELADDYVLHESGASENSHRSTVVKRSFQRRPKNLFG